MANHLRVHVLLNEGKSGISLHRLPKLLADIQKFLDSLAEDTVGRSGEWIGKEFRSTHSIEYTALSADTVEEARAKDFDESLKGVIQSKPDAKIRQSTLAHYARIAEPLDEETVSFGIGSLSGESEDRAEPPLNGIECLEFDKSAAKSLVGAQNQAIVRSHGSIQGRIHTIFLGADPPSFRLRELSTGVLISCEYDRSKYQELAASLQREGAVLHVYGLIFTDFSNRAIQRLRVSRIEIAEVLTKDDLARFVGCAPGLIESRTLQSLIDETRDREPS